MTVRKCEMCRKALKSKQNRFCSKQCLGRNVGILPKPTKQCKFFCLYCNELYLRKLSLKNKTKYCSGRCRSKHTAELRMKENK